MILLLVHKKDLHDIQVVEYNGSPRFTLVKVEASFRTCLLAVSAKNLLALTVILSTRTQVLV